jgi:hypothetical protein
MGYDVTNTTSVVELSTDSPVIEVQNNESIELPSTLPSPELVGQETVLPVGEIITLPDVLPSPELIQVEGITQGNPIDLPTQLPSDPIVLTDGQQLPSDSEGSTIYEGDKYYLHTQSVSASTWEVYHNLGKHPTIHIEDGSGNIIITDIQHIDGNHAHIIFGKSYTGTAHCN